MSYIEQYVDEIQQQIAEHQSAVEELVRRLRVLESAAREPAGAETEGINYDDEPWCICGHLESDHLTGYCGHCLGTTEKGFSFYCDCKRFVPAPEPRGEVHVPQVIVIGREELGMIVRTTWVAYCRETGDTKPSHVAPWDELSEWTKEANRRVGEAIAKLCLPQEVRP